MEGLVRAAFSFAQRLRQEKSTHALSMAYSDATDYITPASSERMARFELARRRWKRLMLPLHHIRIKLVTGIEPATY